MAFQPNAFQNDAFESEDVAGAGELTLNAVILAAIEATFGLDAVIALSQSSSATLDAVLAKTQETSLALDAVLLGTQEDSLGLSAYIYDPSVDVEDPVASSTPGHVDARPGLLSPGAFTPTPTDGAFSLDAVLLKTWDTTFGLEARMSAGLTTVVESFALDAELVTDAGQHSRAHSHFGEQSDEWIYVEDVHGFADGTLLPSVLADLFGRAGTLGPVWVFGLDAIIEGAPITEVIDTFGLDARIAIGGSFGMNSVLKTVLVNTFGLSAYLQTLVVQGNGNIAMNAIIKKTDTLRTFGLSARIV